MKKTDRADGAGCGFHVDARYTEHHTPQGHPERAERIDALVAAAGPIAESGCVMFPSSRSATVEEITRVHTPAHYERMAATAGRPYVMLDADTHTSAHSFETACLAAGAILDMTDAVMDGSLDRGFAAVRPPGHHAERDHAMGFCLFNNIAIAAAHLIEAHGLERVAIVDWDVHHGNGTQHIFESDPRVLFISLHQYPFYPGTGAVDETGSGEGRGKTVNIPLPSGCDDGDYAAAFETIVVPVAQRFEPQFVLISAGFDAHGRDPLGGMRVTADGFSAMADALVDLAARSCGGKLVAVLEGGYSVAALDECTRSVMTSLSGAPGSREMPAAARGIEAIANARRVQEAAGNLS